jgi:hypothetical protein
LVVAAATKEEWKCTTMDGGRLCVTMTGISMMHMLYVGSLDIKELLKLVEVLTLARDQDPFS